ncbi:MAG: hypothetical protein ACE5G2_06765 [Candidatus Krumholzibacteriia bacterium]
MLRQLFERWHAFFIRAVDDRRLPDPTPDYRSFNARTLAPTVALSPPVHAGRRFLGPTAITVRWKGRDPIDDFEVQEPDSSRWTLITSSVTLQGDYGSFPDSLYVLPDRFHWSPWRDWGAEDGSGVRATVRDLIPIGSGPYDRFYIFAVQAMDEAGAVTPVFDWTTPGKNNVALLMVGRGVGPIIQVEESDLGSARFAGGSRPVRVHVAAGQKLQFRWQGDASRYGGEIEASRFGWDLVNPWDDEEWDQGWSPTVHEAPQRSFTEGTHRFQLQVRDDLGLVTEATLELAVHPMTRNRALLFVDDTSAIVRGSGEEEREDERWMQVLTSLAVEAGIEFDPVRDIFDVCEHRFNDLPIELVFEYEAVVWSVREGTCATALRRVARFFDPFADRHTNTARAFNHVNVYLENGGKLWINGWRPGAVMLPESYLLLPHPINVTNWDDLIEPHPFVDSVGTMSLLYRMGVEMFDLGAGTGVPREGMSHFCHGLRRADADAPALVVGSDWGALPGQSGRPNIGIYNMPIALAAQTPPLMPPEGRTLVSYTFVSGVPEDESEGIVYPLTADAQPIFLLIKANLQDAHYSRAFCGFEPHLLAPDSHLRLLEYVLIDKMHLGETRQQP